MLTIVNVSEMDRSVIKNAIARTVKTSINIQYK